MHPARPHAVTPLWGHLAMASTLLEQKDGTVYAQYLNGLAQYHRSILAQHPTSPNNILELGSLRLLDYGAQASPTSASASPAQPVLVVPSMINSYRLVDLAAPDSAHPASFVRHLKQHHAIRPYVIDWHQAEGRDFRAEDYCLQRILPAWQAIKARHPQQQIGLVGYCLGGSLLVAMQMAGLLVDAPLVAIATPWDFHPTAALAEKHRRFGGFGARVIAEFAHADGIPHAALAWLFLLQSGRKTLQKFIEFPQDAQAAARFVAVEDWANSGAPINYALAAQVFDEWYTRNALSTLPERLKTLAAASPELDSREELRPSPVLPRRLVIKGTHDRLVAAQCAPPGEQLAIDTGHVGAMASPRITAWLWDHIAEYLVTLPLVGENTRHNR